MNPSGVRIVLATVPAGADAEGIARALVEERLASSVNVVPGVRSVYRWHGAVTGAEESLLLAKTTAARYPEVERRIRALHPYELPQILSVRPEDGLEGYLEWIGAATA